MIDPHKIRPVGPMVLVEVLPKKTKTDGGIHLLSDTGEDKVGYVWAKIVALGSGKECKGGQRARPKVEPGEVVLVRRYLTEINRLPQVWGLGANYGFVHQDDLIGVRDEEFDLIVTRI